ncbi:efflux RND transporter periplasmic adaptor subunit [Carboxylicivirga sp. RSCT41]|uniref:efflux RND transporter periplasmic adaptor subunit n=1 Tax=Carboxylicivirga agarovorans TaxID=3417570 RepID=UPI003D341935
MKTLKLSIAALAFAYLTQSCGGSSSHTESKQEAVKANVQVVELTTVPKKHHYTGTVSSVNQSTLSTRIMGQISQVMVHEGDAVKKGQLLMSIRSNDIQAKQKQVEANIIQAKAANKHAKDDYQRIQALRSSNSATQKELDDITVHYEMTKAQLEAALKAKDEIDELLAYANIRAPYSGVITQRFVDAGDMANPGLPLLAIEAPGLFEVIAKIPESDVYKMDKGDAVEVMIDACKEPIQGTVARISPSSRFSGSQFDARISLNPDMKQKELIRSGVFAHVNHLKGEEKKILVASSSIVERGQLKGLWTVSTSNQALLRWVRLGAAYGDKTEVLSGLNEGNQIVVSAEGRLYDGAPLQLN